MKPKLEANKPKRPTGVALQRLVRRERDKPKLSDLVEAARAVGVEITIGLEPKEGVTALHPGFRHKVWYGFRDGASTLRLRRKYSLTQNVVEEIIREHLKAPNVES